MNRVFLLLGSNMGNAANQLQQARTALQELSELPIRISSIYKSQPWGKEDQPDFLNQVVELFYKNSPQILLSNVLKIEQLMGRERIEKWGPRIIDIDILFFGDQLVDNENLKIPHPEIPNRRFTLVPMNEIASDFIHPKLKKSINQLLNECRDHLEVEAVSGATS